MTSSLIKNHDEVLELLKNRPKYLETFTTYAPAHRFIGANVTADSLSFSVRDEDGSVFAMALGVAPLVVDCDRLATSRGVNVDTTEFEHRANWDFYSIDTATFGGLQEVKKTNANQEIKEFLEKHAPNSSVWPGNEEILFWGQIRQNDQLVATGTLVKWRTGQVMFASIATHQDFRGQGLAQKLVSQMLCSAERLGIKHVGLGVFAENFSAKRTYEKVGFELIGEFSSYSKITR